MVFNSKKRSANLQTSLRVISGMWGVLEQIETDLRKLGAKNWKTVNGVFRVSGLVF